MSDYIILDDTSGAGLRRKHIMSGEEIKTEPYLQQALADGEVQMWHIWQDELDNYHFYFVWRLNMVTYPIWVRGMNKAETFIESIGKAATQYQERQGRWPNAAIVRKNGVELPDVVELIDQEGSTLALISVKEVDKNWQQGVVGVYEDEDEYEGR